MTYDNWKLATPESESGYLVSSCCGAEYEEDDDGNGIYLAIVQVDIILTCTDHICMSQELCTLLGQRTGAHRR